MTFFCPYPTEITALVQAVANEQLSHRRWKGCWGATKSQTSEVLEIVIFLIQGERCEDGEVLKASASQALIDHRLD